MSKLGILEEVEDLRTIWPHEALDFTPWLAKPENIEILSNEIGIEIVVEDTETNVGSFHLDILATEDGTGKKIIIENQLEETNHDHLGKLITYASGKDANIIIWIVKKAREEHKAAIEWLNNHTDSTVGFFLCELKLYKIGDSKPAVKFEVIEKPNDWSKGTKDTSRMSQVEELRYAYWKEYVEYVSSDKDFVKMFNIQKPATHHWLNHYIGKDACHMALNMIYKRDELVAEIYISDNKELFAKLFKNKEAIEESFGEELDWKELPEKKASRIMVTKSVNDFSDESEWYSQFAWAKDILTRLYKAIKPFI